MTAPVVPDFARNILSHFQRMQVRAAPRERNNDLIHAVRQGHIRQLFPEELNFSVTFQGSPIANFVDIVAHDMAEGLAPLPALACVSGKMRTDADLERAENKNRIGSYFWRCSKLEAQMLKKGADWFVSYGFLPFFIEPDPKCKLPRILIDNPRHSYYELDRYGDVRYYATHWLKSVDELCAMFPEYAKIIRTDPDQDPNDRGMGQPAKEVAGSTELQVVRWADGTNILLFLPQRQGLVLDSYAHKLSRVPVVIAERPSEDDNPRGQFDDVIWVQVARAIMSTLALEAAALAVQAPIAVPDDMDELSVGPHSILASKDAQQIHRVDINIPSTIFAETANLDNELRVGSRYPDARSGNIDASVITGKGVQALLGSFDSQTKGGQIILKAALEDVTSICFELDEMWWPNDVKTVTGTTAGRGYEFTYIPSKDINGRYTCTVTYGFAAGMRDPSQAVVTMLQLEGAGLLAKGTTMENLPFEIDAVQEAKRIDVEGSRNAIKQGFFALLEAAGQMAAQGQDPGPYLQMGVDVVRALEDGKQVEDAIASSFEAMQQQQQAQAAAQAAQQPGAPGGGGGDMGDAATGAPEAGVPGFTAPGQFGMPPGGRPTLEQMIAGIRGNGKLPINQLEIRRSVPTGT